jgi:diphthamide synthase (EF-2-diphthine--ammonia ligase)
VAAQGLGPEWLGRKLDAASLAELTELSKRCGFDVLGEGGHYNTFVCDAPFFRKRIEFVNTAKMWDVRTSSGYLDVKDARLVSKG